MGLWSDLPMALQMVSAKERKLEQQLELELDSRDLWVDSDSLDRRMEPQREFPMGLGRDE